MYILLYSQESVDAGHGYNTSVTITGETVKFTCMINEDEFGPWRQYYGWKDTVVVGKSDGNFKKVECSQYISEGFSQKIKNFPPIEKWLLG